MASKSNIELYLKTLLFENNFVIIPNFGGFILKEIPAKINGLGYTMTPPSKEIVFNPKVIASDGLLQQELVVKENLSYNRAEKVISETVINWKKQLDLSGYITIDGIGMFRKNVSGNITFKHFAHSNFLIDSFGLEIAKAKPLRKELVKKVDSNNSTTEKVETKTIVIEKLPVSYQRFKRISIAAIFILSISASYFYMLSFNPKAIEEAGLNIFNIPIIDKEDLDRLELEKQAQEEIKQVIETTKSITTKNESAVAVDSISNEEVKTTPVELPSETDISESEILEKETIIEAEESTDAEQAIAPIEKSELHYYVIASSLPSNDKVESELNRFRLKGFEPEVINTDGKFRISIGKFATRDSADIYKENIFNDNNLQTWVLPQ